MIHEKGTWHACPCVTLALCQLYKAPSMSINTNYAACDAKSSFRKQENAPKYGRYENPPISSEHDLTCGTITLWIDMVGDKK